MLLRSLPSFSYSHISLQVGMTVYHPLSLPTYNLYLSHPHPTHMSSETQVPVLIIGGGIVGLSASLCLSHHGIHSLLIERHSGTSIHPRARSVNARTMELFRGLGIDDLVREAGASISSSMGMHSGNSLKEVIEAKPRKEGPKKFPLSGLRTYFRSQFSFF